MPDFETERKYLNVISYLNTYCDKEQVEYIIQLFKYLINGDIELNSGTYSIILDELENSKYFIESNMYERIIPIFKGIINDKLSSNNW